jgi:hypothetical protein
MKKKKYQSEIDDNNDDDNQEEDDHLHKTVKEHSSRLNGYWEINRFDRIVAIFLAGSAKKRGVTIRSGSELEELGSRRTYPAQSIAL